MLPGRGPPPEREPPERGMPWEGANGLLPGRGPEGRGAEGRGPGRPPVSAAGFCSVADSVTGVGSGADSVTGAADAAARPGAVGRADVFAGFSGVTEDLGAALAGVSCAAAAGTFGSAAAAAAFFAAGPGAGFFAAGAGASTGSAEAAGWVSRSLRTTGGSIVDDAERTNSPSSFSVVIRVLLSTPSSLASS